MTAASRRRLRGVLRAGRCRDRNRAPLESPEKSRPNAAAVRRPSPRTRTKRRHRSTPSASHPSEECLFSHYGGRGGEGARVRGGERAWKFRKISISPYANFPLSPSPPLSSPPHTEGGTAFQCPVASSKKWAALRSRASEKRGPISCRDSGSRWPEKPDGKAIAGAPIRFAGAVKMSDRYIESGSEDFSPIRNAGEGVVGVAMKSKRSNTASNSRRMSARTF